MYHKGNEVDTTQLRWWVQVPLTPPKGEGKLPRKTTRFSSSIFSEKYKTWQKVLDKSSQVCYNKSTKRSSKGCLHKSPIPCGFMSVPAKNQLTRFSPSIFSEKYKTWYKTQMVCFGCGESPGVPLHPFESGSPICGWCLRLSRQRDDVRSSRTASKLFSKRS